MTASDETFTSFLGSLPWPVILLDAEGNILQTTHGIDGGGGTPPGTVTALRAAFPEYYDALQGVDPWLSDQETVVTRTGTHAPVHEQIILRKLPQGACLIVIDRTDAVALEVADIQTARLASLGFMVAGVCHELSNPLTAIRSMTELLQSSGDAADATLLRKGVKSIGTHVQRLLDISGKLLDFSRVGSRPRMAFPVDTAIHDALSSLQQDRHFQHVTINTQPDPAAVVFGDPSQLQEVFCNIAMNAAQAMGGEGELLLITRRPSDNRVEVLIKDNGPGIPAQFMSRLIEPFFTTKAAGCGTGLGLTISNEIIDEHGGTIQVENNTDKGATFFVRLPLYRKRI